jgi:hypothetical protein
MSSALTVTLWRTFSRGRRSTYTWREFIDTFIKKPEVVHDKTIVAGYSLGAFEGNRRALHRVEHVNALVLDFDSGDTTVKKATQLIPETQSAVYTTFSHMPRRPKLRVIYPLSRPVNAQEYAALWAWAESKITPLGHALDESARDASRFWYLPSHRPGAPYQWRETEGALLDVARALEEAPPPSRLLPGGSTPPKPRIDRQAPGSSRAWSPVGLLFFGRAFVLAGRAFDEIDNGALVVSCPWGAEHTVGADGDTSTVLLPPTLESRWELFHCMHAHCAHRTTLDLLDVLPFEALDAARRECGYGLVRTKIRSGWVQHLPSFDEVPSLDRLVMRCYPERGAPFIWTVKIGSRPHVEGLGGLPIEKIIGKRVDLAVNDRDITWGRLVGAP